MSRCFGIIAVSKVSGEEEGKDNCGEDLGKVEPGWGPLHSFSLMRLGPVGRREESSLVFPRALSL